MVMGRQLATASGLVIVLFLAPGTARADPTLRERSYHLDLLHIEAAQVHSRGRDVVVAVVDSGVDAEHVDLAGQVLDGMDLTGAGAAASDESGHGTAMAGVIAGKGGGPNHILGIAPGVKILPVRIREGGKDPNATIAKGIRAAVDGGAAVVNVSLGASGPPARDEQDAVSYAVKHDAVVIASAGNTSLGMVDVASPANIPGVIAVTGLDKQGQFWSGSTKGNEAVISAPGQDIPSTDSRKVSTTGYELGNGTSDSAAIVSGVVALIRSKYRTLDAANVINRLIRTADDLGPPGRDPQYGFGRVNPLKALTDSVPPVTTNPLGAPQTSSPAATPTTPHSTSALGPWTNPDAGIPPWLLATLGALALLLVSVTIFLVARAIRRPSENPHHPLPPPAGLP